MVAGQQYRINTDYRSCLRVILAFEDNDLTPQEKQSVLLDNIYQVVPGDLEQAFIQALWFLNSGRQQDAESDGARLYSFAKDASFIFSAFKQTHDLDLRNAELHWWVFLALFMDLGTDTTFCQLIGLRKRLSNGTASKEERRAALDMGDLLNVPDVDDHTLEEKERMAEFMRYAKGLS
jgi:hypothetical protein